MRQLFRLLSAIAARRNSELVLERGGEMRQRTESRHVRNLRHVIFSFHKPLGGDVQLVFLEEYGRRFARKTLDLIIELRP